MRPLEFSADFFPPKKGRFGAWGQRIFMNFRYPRVGTCVLDVTATKTCFF